MRREKTSLLLRSPFFEFHLFFLGLRWPANCRCLLSVDFPEGKVVREGSGKGAAFGAIAAEGGARTLAERRGSYAPKLRTFPVKAVFKNNAEVTNFFWEIGLTYPMDRFHFGP